MAAIVYPEALPCPQTASLQRPERRALSSLPGLPKSRPLWRDKAGTTQPLTFVLTSVEMVQEWIDWGNNDLGDWGNWFAADWPQPEGGVGVRRFVGVPSYPEFFPTLQAWRVTAQVEIRGRSELPMTHADLPWTDRTLPFSAAWQYTGWSEDLGQFCAVCVGAQCATSEDGITWTARNMPSSASWSRLIWASEIGLWIAVAYNSNKAATSPDGITWTARTLPAASLWAGLNWNGSLAVLIDNNNSRRVLTTSDGINWTAHTTALPSNASWDGLEWAVELGLWVTIASFSTKAATSPDGVTWTARTLPTNSYWREIAWSGALFVVTNYNPAATTYLTSPDGINWTQRTVPVATKWGSVCWNDTRNLFCMVGNGAISLFSIDGLSWTQEPMDSSLAWYAVVWGHGAGVFVAVADEATSIANSKRLD